MRLATATTALLALACAPPAGAAPKPRAPTIVVFSLTSTVADLAIMPDGTAAVCRVWYLDKDGTPHHVRSTGTADAHAARIVGLRPQTSYEYWASCGYSESTRGTFTTLPAPGPVPPLPQIVGIALTPGSAPKTFVATATFVAPGAVPTACWWEWSSKEGESYVPDHDIDCTGAGTTLSFRPIQSWLRFVMRNAAGQVTSTPVQLPK
ncbi:MAG: hypothetical protein HYV09_33910 [Deltaproteobacteria bacterium]|nr:hypothetical protein [Deltaproteobacteria bacterium]